MVRIRYKGRVLRFELTAEEKGADRTPYLPNPLKIRIDKKRLAKLRGNKPQRRESHNKYSWLDYGYADGQERLPRHYVEMDKRRDPCPAEQHDVAYHGNSVWRADQDYWQFQIE